MTRAKKEVAKARGACGAVVCEDNESALDDGIDDTKMTISKLYVMPIDEDRNQGITPLAEVKETRPVDLGTQPMRKRTTRPQ